MSHIPTGQIRSIVARLRDERRRRFAYRQLLMRMAADSIFNNPGACPPAQPPASDFLVLKSSAEVGHLFQADAPTSLTSAR